MSGVGNVLATGGAVLSGGRFALATGGCVFCNECSVFTSCDAVMSGGGYV